MSLRTRSLSTVLLFASTVLPAIADTPAGPPMPPTPAAAYTCPVQVLDAVPLDEHKALSSSPASVYAIGIQAFQRTSAAIAGTIAVFANGMRYDIPFKDAVAAGSTAASLPEIVPVVVKFAAPLRIDAVYVASIDGPNAGPCEADGALVSAPKPAYAKMVIATIDIAGYIVRRSAGATIVTAPAPTVLPAAGCGSPFAQAAMVHPAMAYTPELAKREGHSGIVGVEVVLSRSGSMATQWVWESSGFPELDETALTAAKNTTFAATKLRCQASAGAYFFVVVFARD